MSGDDGRPADQAPLGRCPVCRKPTQERWRPFCSKRCADVDLNRWLGGSYVIPGAFAPEDDAESLPVEDQSGK